MAGDEEGFVGEREGVEVVEGVGEEGRRGEEGDEAAAVVEEGGGEGVREVGELRRGEGGEGSHESGLCDCLVSHDYGIKCWMSCLHLWKGNECVAHFYTHLCEFPCPFF